MDAPPFLETLGADSLAALRRSWLVKRWARGETILHHGDPGSDVYVVLDGIARASVASEDGKTVAYTEFVAGDIFGEFSAIDQGPRSADVVAWTDMSIGRLPAAAFAQLVERDAGFTWALLRHFTRISRTQNRRVFEFSTMLVRERLVQELLRLARLGTESGGRVEIAPAPTHQDIAARISTHREAVSREMSRLAKLGLVARRSGGLVLPDLEGLRRLGVERVGPTDLPL